MTPREIIKGNLYFTAPKRIGFGFGYSEADDVVFQKQSSEGFFIQRRWTEGRFEYYDDEWGNVWFRVADMGAGGEIHKAAIKDWAQLDGFKLPDLANPVRYTKVKAAFEADREHYRIGGLPGFPFAICRYLRKMEIYFQDLILERENIDRLHDRVAGLLEQMIAQYAISSADGVFFCEDWGIQDRLLIHPDMWRDIFKPLFQRLCDKAHSLKLDIWMHSCGYNWDILDDLADVGVNVLQFDQPALYGLERLAGKLQSRRVCLCSPVDIQRIMPTGNRKLIEASARDMCRLFGAQRGGFVAGSYGDLKGIGVLPEWDQWAREAFIAYSRLPCA